MRCEECGTESEGPGITGMVIGNNVFLTPAEIRQMRAIPELVFINCCHLGRIEDTAKRPLNDPPGLAANVATELIRMGVRAVVAAGWEVDDAAAQTFATTFYREMLSGTSFGCAVQRARQAVYEQHPGVNTWGAYQCYGDPSFTLSRGSSDGIPGHTRVHYAAPAEAIAELENIAEDATTASGTELADLQARVMEIDESLPEDWRALGEVRAALGHACGELDLFERAVAATECRLLKHLAEGDLAEHTEEIIAGYLEVKRRDASPREFRSVLEQLDFLSRMIAEAKSGEVKEHLGALEAIRRGIAAGLLHEFYHLLEDLF